MSAASVIKVGAHEILIDAEDAPTVCQYRWNVVRSRNNFYARTRINGTSVKLHQFLLPHAEMVDHKDANGLNNTRQNLRPCNRFQNVWNSRKIRAASSRFKGVSKVKNRIHSFEASVTACGRRVKLGRFFDEVAAALAYDLASVTLHGEFARPNFTITEAALIHPEAFHVAIERCKQKGIIPAI